MARLFKILFLILIISNMAQAAGQADQAKQMDKVISKIYSEQMNKYFLKMSNLSKTAKNGKEFMQKLFDIPVDLENSEKLNRLEKISVQPIVMIKNGIEFSENGQKTQIKLTDTLGELAVSTDKNKTGLFYWKKNSLMNSIAGFAFGKPAYAFLGIGKYADKVAQYMSEIDNATTFTAKVTSAAKLMGLSVATGAGTGCIIGTALAGAYNQDRKEGCVNTAVVGGAALGGMAGIGFAATTRTVEAGIDVLKQAVNFKPFAKVKNVSAAVKDVGLGSVIATVGTVGVLVKTFEPEIFQSGAQLVCGARGQFKMTDISGKNNLYSSNFAMSDLSPKATEGMSDEQKAELQNILKQDIEAKSDACKKRGAGYTEKYYFSSGETTNAVRGDNEKAEDVKQAQ